MADKYAEALERLRKLREEVLQEIYTLQIKLQGIDQAIATVQGEDKE